MRYFFVKVYKQHLFRERIARANRHLDNENRFCFILEIKKKIKNNLEDVFQSWTSQRARMLVISLL